MISVRFSLMFVAALCFALDAVGVVTRINLTPLGLLFLTLAMLVA